MSGFRTDQLVDPQKGTGGYGSTSNGHGAEKLSFDPVQLRKDN
jgi:hypothetical protein